VLRSHGDIFPVARPDAADLERFMFEVDAPYSGRRTSDGGIEIVARGRSAICLLIWLEELVNNPARHGDMPAWLECPKKSRTD
jgi:hypothetical protein